MDNRNGTDSRTEAQEYLSDSSRDNRYADAGWLTEYGLQAMLHDVALEWPEGHDAVRLLQQNLADASESWCRGYGLKALVTDLHRQAGLS